jgi:hypothetical protein
LRDLFGFLAASIAVDICTAPVCDIFVSQLIIKEMDWIYEILAAMGRNYSNPFGNSLGGLWPER